MKVGVVGCGFVGGGVGLANFPEVAFSMPRIAGAAGVLTTLLPDLPPEDHQALTKSIDVIQGAAAEIAFSSTVGE
jgi:hypothetical protein